MKSMINVSTMVRPDRLSRSLNQIIKGGLKSLDLSSEQHQRATKEYELIAEHIEAEGQFCAKYDPDIYAQGSMALGTCVRPISREEFDLDMVVAVDPLGPTNFDGLLDELTQIMADYNGPDRCEKLACCLRLHYPGEFHLDLVPAFKDPCAGNPKAICVASKTSTLGNPSDPKAFEEEFEEKKALVLVTEKQFSANDRTIYNKQASVDPPPREVSMSEKTVLQTLVQLLKRHCLIYFKDRKDRPSSAAITALCSETYIGHQNLYEATEHALQTIGAAVRPTAPRVPNPRYLVEDFADRWANSPELEVAFFEWLQAAQADFRNLGDFKLKTAEDTLEPWMGKSAARHGVDTFTETTIESPRSRGRLGFAGGLGLTAAWSSGVKAASGTSFCGNEAI